MTRVRFEPTILIFEWQNAERASRRAATAIDIVSVCWYELKLDIVYHTEEKLQEWSGRHPKTLQMCQTAV
jgi:hypothetical protein